MTYPGHATAHGVGEKLDDIDVDADGRIPEREEQIHGGDDGGCDQANDPRADRVGGYIFIVVANRGAHLEVR